jgi:CheY-like chemotaxis protein
MDGLETTRRILARWPESERPWIVAMTAEAMIGDRERCLEAGMNDYLAKPIRPDELVAAIKRSPRRAGNRIASARGDGVGDEPVDPKSLQRLAEGVRGDIAFVSELIDQFLADALGLVASARSGVESADAEKVRRAAHTLKSNAATFGARALSERCRALEAAAKTNALDDGLVQVDDVARELERVREALPKVWGTMSRGESVTEPA